MPLLLRSLSTLALLVLLSQCALSPFERRLGLKPEAVLQEQLAVLQDYQESGLTSENATFYNETTEKATRAWLVAAEDQGDLADFDQSGSYQLQVTQDPRIVFDTLYPTSRFKQRVTRTQVRRAGLGSTWVARWEGTEERQREHPLMDAMYLGAATTVIDIQPGAGGEAFAELKILDPRFDETVTIGSKHYPLASDLTAINEYVMKYPSRRIPKLAALINANKYLEMTQLLAIEPVDADRVPIVLVHGLMSEPLTWQNVYNELRADPELARRYQFFFFRYPTGVPVPYSAARFREELAELSEKLNRLGNPYTDDMLLVGHSMGGLVTKAQLQGTDDRLWIALFGRPRNEIELTPESMELVQKYLDYEPNPYISRAVFIATPHRGSQLATGFIGNLARRIIRVPTRVLSGAMDVLTLSIPQRSGSDLERRIQRTVPTSLDSLRPDSPWLAATLEVPKRPDLTIHSIIGNKTKFPVPDPKSSDGVVPYSSAHIGEVESELVVPSGHSAHEHPKAVEELARIMHLHLENLR